MARKTGAVNDGSVPISVCKERVEKHLHHTITNKQIALLDSGWVTRYCITTNHDIHPRTPYQWLQNGYVPREHANNLMNYLITGERVV